MENSDAVQLDGYGYGDDYEFEYFQSLDILRLLLMLVASANIFGIGSGSFVAKIGESIAGIAPIAFYMISGFLVLGNNSKIGNAKIGRTMGRTGLLFLIMTVVYLGTNALCYYYFDGVNILAATPFNSKLFWFKTLALNIWPYAIGQTIWYVQALFYGYVIIYIFRKLHLAKIEWLLFILLEVFAFVSGEFADVFNFQPLASVNIPYIPECFLTCALPYLLLGGIMRRSMEKLSDVPTLIYILGVVFGIALSYFEEAVLTENGYSHSYHFIGTVVASFCIIAITVLEFYGDAPKLMPLSIRSRFYLVIMYFVFDPVGTIMNAFIKVRDPWLYGTVKTWIWLIAYCISFIIAVLICLLWENLPLLRRSRRTPD